MFLPELVCKEVQWADRLVEIFALHFGRQEFCIVPPKMHGRFHIGLPEMHGWICIGLSKVNGRFCMDPPKCYIQLHMARFQVSHSIFSHKISKKPLRRARPIGQNVWNSTSKIEVSRSTPRLEYQVLTVDIAYCSNTDKTIIFSNLGFSTQTRCTKFPQSGNSVDHCYYGRKATIQWSSICFYNCYMNKPPANTVVHLYSIYNMIWEGWQT